MNRFGFRHLATLVCLVISCVSLGVATGQDYPITPAPFTKVRIADDFWTRRMETHREITVPNGTAG